MDVTRFEETREATAAHRSDIMVNSAACADVDGAGSGHAGAYKLKAVAPRNLSAASFELGIPLVNVSTNNDHSINP